MIPQTSVPKPATITLSQGCWPTRINRSGFNGLGHATFAPSERIAYNFNATYAVAVEHYAEYGPVRALVPVNRSYQDIFAVADYTVSEATSFELGAGFGLTKQSDAMLLKLVLNHHF